jgi:hypothetical protein
MYFPKAAGELQTGFLKLQLAFLKPPAAILTGFSKAA